MGFGLLKPIIRLLLATALFGTSGGWANENPSLDDRLDILFVGNSLTYANDLPRLVETILQHGQQEVGRIEMRAHANWGLQDHWSSHKTHKHLDAHNWDLVVLQQGPSATEGRPSLLRYSARFADKIRSNGGQTALYMVWPSASRSFDFAGVIDSYRSAAEQVDGTLFPAGEAWQLAWNQDRNLPLYDPDRFHPSSLGTLLVAFVISDQLAPGILEDPGLRSALVEMGAPEDRLQIMVEAAAEANARARRGTRP